MKYPLALSTWDKKEYDAIKKVVNSGIFTMGKYVYKFEKQMAKFLGSKYCVMANSGSSANLLAIASLFFTKNQHLKSGDEVIVPAISWATTYAPLTQYGLKLRFVDVDYNTLNICLNSLKKAITKKTKAIFIVNLLGNPNDFDEIKKICKEKKLILIEDNCESLGAKFKGRQAGTFGLLGTFSSFFSHHISTMEGGIVSTHNQELYHILLSLRSHGWTRHLPRKNHITKLKSRNEFEESFKFVLPGYNLRPLELSGAIGIEQLKKLPLFIKNRRKNAKVFYQQMEDFSDIFSFQKEIGESSFFGFSLILKNKSLNLRNKLVNFLIKNKIECRPVVAGNFTKNPVVKYFNYNIYENLKNTNFIHNNGFFVGNHHLKIESQIKFLKSKLKQFFR